jgi:hypothetical protein
MAGEHHFGSLIHQMPDRWQRTLDAGVVSYLSIRIHWHIEVHAHEARFPLRSTSRIVLTLLILVCVRLGD